MRSRFWIGPLGLVMAVGLCGCHKSTTTVAVPKTGAAEAARHFFECLVRQEWSTAYALLDAESRAWCTPEEFERRARQHLDFVPSEVSVSVSEAGATATAVAVYRGKSGEAQKQHRDGAALRRTANGWAVVLRKNFGG